MDPSTNGTATHQQQHVQGPDRDAATLDNSPWAPRVAAVATLAVVFMILFIVFVILYAQGIGTVCEQQGNGDLARQYYQQLRLGPYSQPVGADPVTTTVYFSPTFSVTPTVELEVDPTTDVPGVMQLELVGVSRSQAEVRVSRVANAPWVVPLGSAGMLRDGWDALLYDDASRRLTYVPSATAVRGPAFDPGWSPAQQTVSPTRAWGAAMLHRGRLVRLARDFLSPTDPQQFALRYEARATQGTHFAPIEERANLFTVAPTTGTPGTALAQTPDAALLGVAWASGTALSVHASADFFATVASEAVPINNLAGLAWEVQMAVDSNGRVALAYFDSPTRVDTHVKVLTAPAFAGPWTSTPVQVPVTDGGTSEPAFSLGAVGAELLLLTHATGSVNNDLHVSTDGGATWATPVANPVPIAAGSEAYPLQAVAFSGSAAGARVYYSQSWPTNVVPVPPALVTGYLTRPGPAPAAWTDTPLLGPQGLAARRLVAAQVNQDSFAVVVVELEAAGAWETPLARTLGTPQTAVVLRASL